MKLRRPRSAASPRDIPADRARAPAVRRQLVPLCLLAACVPAFAAEIRVGPGQRVTRISEAARIARDGDTVLVMPGVYPLDVAVWKQKSLSIRGLDPRPILDARGRSAEGKAIWVIRDGRFRIENIEFRNARAAGMNGAGIRFERGQLTVERCVFRNNQMGLLTGNDPASTLRVIDSLFADAPRQTQSLPHLLYVGTIAHFELSGSRFENGYWGHLVKSRARVSVLRYNLIVDGPQGHASYEVDLPNGGDATLLGNIIGKNAMAENRALIAYGAEGLRWDLNRLRVAHNTLLSDGPEPVSFIRWWPERLTPETEVLTRNNFTVGPAAIADGLSGSHRGNAGVESNRFRLTDVVAGLGNAAPQPPQVAAAGSDGGESLMPSETFQFPFGTRPIVRPRNWVAGAVQPEEAAIRGSATTLPSR